MLDENKRSTDLDFYIRFCESSLIGKTQKISFTVNDYSGVLANQLCKKLLEESRYEVCIWGNTLTVSIKQ